MTLKLTEQQLKSSIRIACGTEPRDFTEEEKNYITSSIELCGNTSSFIEDLRAWYESTLSDECWTEANMAFFDNIFGYTYKTSSTGECFTEDNAILVDIPF